MSLTKDKVEKIISTQGFDQLKGELENEWLECKECPYQLGKLKYKRELAKDASSFANAGGGYILIGLRTKASKTHFGDEIEEIRPFSQELIDKSQYHDVINSWIYPEIEKISIEWICIDTSNQKGILIIKIPEQNPETKPFLITKVIEDNVRQTETLFGYAERKRDFNQTMACIELQKILKTGLSYKNEFIGRFNSLEALIKQILNSYPSIMEKSNDEEINSKIEEILEYEDIKLERVIVLTAYATPKTELKSIFNLEENSIRRKLEDPPSLRRYGWNLETKCRAEIMFGKKIRVAIGSMKVIDLYRDGTLIFLGLADGGFLAHGGYSETNINSIAIVELIYNFLNFYKLVIDDFNNKPRKIFTRVDFKNFHKNGEKTCLSPFSQDRMMQPIIDSRESKEAPNDSDKIIKEFSAQNFTNSAITAYEFAKEIYLWFSFEEDKVPFLKEENGQIMIDSQQIKDLD